MTSGTTLKAQKRNTKEKKPQGVQSVPAVLYGRGISTISLWVSEKKFNNAYNQVGESAIFKLDIEGDTRSVLIKEVQRDPLSDEVQHVDFYQVRMDEEIEAEIDLVFRGESPAVKELGGVLVKNMDTVEVRCLPGDLPKNFEVDISRIKTFDDYIYVKDLLFPDKVETLIDPETVIAMVSPPRTEEELAELEGEVKEDVSQVEGVEKEKAESEEAVPEEKAEEKQGKEEEKK